MLRVALLSKWHVHAEGYGEEFRKLPFVKITAVWDEQPERGREWAKAHGCDFEESLCAVLAREDVDAVCVTTPTSMHREVICAAAKAGKAIFTEKVLGITNEDAEAIAQAVREAGVPFCISYPFRTKGALLLAKKLADSGKIGRVTHLRVRDAHNGISAGWLPDSFFDLKQCGGGAMMDLGAHPMYLSYFFLGAPVTVASSFTKSGGKGVDDNCVSLLTYANGAIATAETGFLSSCCPITVELNGTEGYMLYNDATNELLVKTREEEHVYKGDELPADLPKPVELFAYGVEEGKEIPFTVEDGVALSRLMVAAYRAAEEQRTVEF